MLPVLLWEVTWKTMWLALVPLPQWMAGHVDAAIQPSVFACSMVVLVYLAIPWGYVWRHYVRASGTPWGWGAAAISNRRVMGAHDARRHCGAWIATAKGPRDDGGAGRGRYATSPYYLVRRAPELDPGRVRKA